MRLGVTLLFFLSIILIHYAYSTTDEDPLIVKIPNGLVKGKDNGHYYSWESIPYAEAPQGQLRFEAPQPYRQQWSEVFDATPTPEPCIQVDPFEPGDNKLIGVEDCLKVNVYRPKSQGRNKYPVMVFIHGGCFMFGATRAFQHDNLMASGQVMLVKIAYRVGPLGFLSTADEHITGNFGLKDQQLALQWIKDNIASFGGDSSKILLTGFSAGAASTHYQMLQPSLQNIAVAAASFSGVALDPWVLIRNPRENAFKLAQMVNCPNTENTLELKKCLKAQRAQDIVVAVLGLLTFGYNPFTTFGPVIEHPNAAQAFMTQHPKDIIKSGNFSHIPWLTAYTAEDGGFNAGELLTINPQTGKEFIYDLNEKWPELAGTNLFLQNIHNEPQKYALELKQRYLGDFPFSVENYLKVQEMYTDVLYRNGALESLKLHSKHSMAPTYGYVYSNPPDYGIGYLMSQRKDITFGTNHMDDFTLVLNLPTRSPPRPDEKVISQKFIQMLTDFVETGKLSYGDCNFENNAGVNSDQIKLLLITKDKCETITENV